MKKNVVLFLLFIFLLCNKAVAQNNDSQKVTASFTYVLQAKPSKKEPEKNYKELFSLQITENRAYFSSDVLAKRDSISKLAIQNTKGSTVIDFRGRNMPKTLYPFVIIQNSNKVSLYQNVGFSLLSYEEEVMNNWKLINESRTIENFVCKKAELRYKGRDWVAWYSPEIPIPYGPYKFSGLPGLIVQISDKTEEYGFRLVAAKSKNPDAMVNLRTSRYTNAKMTTQKELEQAIDNFNINMAQNASISNTVVNVDERFYRERRQRYIDYKENYNPIEISEK